MTQYIIKTKDIISVCKFDTLEKAQWFVNFYKACYTKRGDTPPYEYIITKETTTTTSEVIA